MRVHGWSQITMERIEMRYTIRLLVLLFPCILGTPLALAGGGHDPASGPSPTNWYDGFLFEDASLTFEFIRSLGYACQGGADLGECISTARRVKAGDSQSWYDEWKKTADRLYAHALKMKAAGNEISAREAYLRASCYYRCAGFYMRAETELPAALISWNKSRECFRAAIASLPFVQTVRIPYEDTTLPGYFLKAVGSETESPLLIVHTGFDGTAEELFFEVGTAAIRRGYNCLIFEGPGQGEMIREQKVPFRYDWEKVVTPVIDFAMGLPQVDPDKIALLGISMGGYLAPRAAAFDKRIKVCIANGGVYDLVAGMCRGIPAKAMELLDTDPTAFDEAMKGAMKENTAARWLFQNGMWTFDAPSPAAFINELKRYHLKDVVKQITCHMIVIESSADAAWEGQPKQFYDKLKCPKDYVRFGPEDAGQSHCQMGATAISNEIIFDHLRRALQREGNSR